MCSSDLSGVRELLQLVDTSPGGRKDSDQDGAPAVGDVIAVAARHFLNEPSARSTRSFRLMAAERLPTRPTFRCRLQKFLD